jgi:UBX domain-containing protein 1
MVLKLWKNGFSIDSGPLRDFKDPANKEFLDSIAKGYVKRTSLTEQHTYIGF